MEQRLRIAIQKKGRLHTDSMELLKKCGVKIKLSRNGLFYHSENLPIDILLVRDDDIPTLIQDKICELGIVGQNVLLEYQASPMMQKTVPTFEVVKSLGFGRCYLAIAGPKSLQENPLNQLNQGRIATSYPNLLSQFLTEKNIHAEILSLSGSVEIAPRLGMADAICDLVSTGRTLEENNLVELCPIMHSQAVLLQVMPIEQTEKKQLIELLLCRMDGVLRAQESKYILFHAPKQTLNRIVELLPGSESPTILPLEGCDDKMVVHVVTAEGVFWQTLERLKDAGASSILVLPIEKMLN
ncbi:MAG: ATP phosphoribosyltransferase [Legionellales bacterium]|nr:ATP phosphoribosyltransferase [Legionellales bacterium]